MSLIGKAKTLVIAAATVLFSILFVTLIACFWTIR